MKKLFLLFLLFSCFAFSQMPNISKVWLNSGTPYSGTITSKKDTAPIRLKINLSEQNRKNDEEYFVSGNSIVENQTSEFEGKIRITKYKDRKKSGTVFGEYELTEKPGGARAGTFNGKFTYTFTWDPKTEKITAQHLNFSGKWKSYDGKLHYRTTWKNQ